jgi:hypothetical protein
VKSSRATESRDENFWETHIKSWCVSGLSQRVYCLRQRLPLSTFQLWRRRLADAEEPAAPSFEIVPVAGVARTVNVWNSPPCPVALLVGGGRYRVEVSDGVTAETLGVLLDALENR